MSGASAAVLRVATVALFVTNAAAFTAFAWSPAAGDLRRVLARAILPYAAVVGAVAWSRRRRLALRTPVPFGLLVVYGVVVVAGTVANLSASPLADLTQALGLVLGIAALGVLLPALLAADDFARIVSATVRVLAGFAVVGLYVELTSASQVFGVDTFVGAVRDQGRVARAFAVHHTAVAHDLQWLPWSALVLAASRRDRPRRFVVDALAAAACGAYVVATGSRQGILFLAGVGVVLAAQAARASAGASARRALAGACAGVAAACVLAFGLAPASGSGFAAQGLRLSGRLTIWHETLARIDADGRHLAGYGITPALFQGWMPSNSALTHLAAFGVLGFVAFAALTAATLWRVATAVERPTAAHVVMLASVAGLTMQMAVEDFAVRPYSGAYLSFWFLVGASGAFRRAPQGGDVDRASAG